MFKLGMKSENRKKLNSSSRKDRESRDDGQVTIN